MIRYIDRASGTIQVEKVYKESLIRFLYGGDTLLSRWFGKTAAYAVSHTPCFSQMAGWWYARPASRDLIEPFIKRYGIDPKEFLESPGSFTSFNDFFIRKLKSAARPFSHSPGILPADARYTFFDNVDLASPFSLKGEKFNLPKLFQDDSLAAAFSGGTLVIGRICPSDYHRFHFPADGIFEAPPRLINGPLYSVNPLALRRNLSILWENKRVISILDTPAFGKVAYLEIGATSVGSIIQTHDALLPFKKGDEKGYFAFGGSCLVLLFEKGRLSLSQDLLKPKFPHLEIRGLLGQPLV